MDEVNHIAGQPGEPQRPPSKPKIRWFRALAHVLFSLLAIILIAIAALWWWTGSEGSLATAIRLAQKYVVKPPQQLTVEGATGSIRAGGHIDSLQYQQEGLKVDAGDVSLAWQPLSLLQGSLKLDRFAAATVMVDDRRPPSAPSSGPPESIKLPIQLTLDDFSVGSFRMTQASSPNPVEIKNLAGSYAYNGQEHQLNLRSVEAFGGRYQGRAVISDSSPLTLDANVSGGLAVSVPSSSTTLPVTFEVTAKGPLTELSVNATAQTGTPAGSTPAPISAAPTAAQAAATAGRQPNASVNATVRPWASQPVPRAEASFNQLNVGALWPQAPQTLLNGTASVKPLSSTTAKGTPSGPATGSTSLADEAWAIQLQLANRLPGPWDQQRLPLDELQADAQWRNGTAVIQSLKAQTGGGELRASGTWSQPAATANTGLAGSETGSSPIAPPAPPAPQDWKLQATLKGINPAALHTQLAPLPLSGDATASSQGESINFDAKLQAAAALKTPAARRNPLGQLQLQSANAAGSWNPNQGGGTLALSSLRVRTNDAEMSGQLEAQIAQLGGKGNLSFTAPGLNADVKGELREKSGGGALNLRIGNVAKTLAWVDKLPGIPTAVKEQLRSAAANGRADLSAKWQGGWQDPALQAQLGVPSLDVRLPASENPRDQSPASGATDSSRSNSSTTSTANSGAGSSNEAVTPDVLKLRDIQATVSGRLGKAQLNLQGAGEMGERRLRMELGAEAGTTARFGNGSSLATAPWEGLLKRLETSVKDPALSAGTWSLLLREPVPLKWVPAASAKAAPTFEAGAGQAVLNAPTAKASNATIAWQPVRWSNGELITAGKITGLPMAWMELFGGSKSAGSALSGTLVFNGAWDARLADTLNLKASLERSSGDIAVQADTGNGRSTQVAAGVRQARVSLTSDGNALSAALVWDSARAGTADGQLRTRLTRTPDTAEGPGGWTWAPDAPLDGRLRAQLPRIGVWSVLAPPGWRIKGSLGADVAVGGTKGDPRLSGTLQANDLALRSVVDGIEFGNGRLRATLDGTRMRIDEFSLQGASPVGGEGKNTGTGGIIIAKGEAALIDGKPRVDLNVRLDRLRASIRTDRQLTVSGALQASLENNLASITGALKIDQALIVLPEEGTPQLGDNVVVRGSARAAELRKKAEAQARSKPVAAEKDGALRVKVVIEIDVGDDFRVRGKGIDTQLKGRLTLIADALTEPRLNGEIRTLGGKYRAYGQRLDIEKGIIRFTGQIDNPTLDILAIRPNLSQRVGVQIRGTALLPNVRLYAEPDLPDAEKLSWLVLGRSSATGGGEAALLQQAAVALLGSKGGGSGGGIAGKFGLDELSYGDASGGAGGSAVTLGKRFSDNFYAAYERSLSGAVGTLRIFYDLSRRFTVRAEAGTQSALDLIFTFQYD